MEAKINIAKILEDKPQGTKLYSLTYGGCFYQEYTGDFGIECQSQSGVQFNLDEHGRYYIEGECILCPSKEMRDWFKFAWKKGDVLSNKDGDVYIIFEGFADDTYCSFVGKYYLWKENNNTEQFYKKERLLTSDFQKADKDAAQTYINTIEEKLGGKLNRETLEIEKQPNFKDGDIVALVVRKCTHIAIFQSRQEKYIGFHAVLCQNDELLLEEPFREDDGDIELRPATDSEKQQLFEALAKEGKAWDAEKKRIVDLKPKWTPKPFDRVITRNAADDVWTANIFSHMDSHGEYVTIACVGGYTYCLPYNEETAKLIGTTNNWEG